MIYNLLTLGFRPNTLPGVMPDLPGIIAASLPGGTLLGCFNCEFGVVNRVSVLTGYPDPAALAEDRGKVAAAGSPLGLGEHLAAFEQVAYAPMPFLPQLEPGAHGPFYEIRSYGIAAGSMPTITEAWSAAYAERNAISPMLLVMGSLDAAPERLVHIWPYQTLDARTTARAAAPKTGNWPPKGWSQFILSQQSELFVATPFSPLA